MEEQICTQLREYNRLFKAEDGLYRRASRRFDLPETELWILYFLRLEGACSQRELREKLLQPKQSVNTALQNMARRGSVTLEEDPGDRRGRRVCLTVQGIAEAEGTADRLIAAERQAMAALTPREREQMLNLWARYVNALGEELNGGTM